MRHLYATACLAFGLSSLANAGLAQGQSTRIGGTILAVSAETLRVHTDDGDVAIVLPAGVRIGAVAERTLADIRPGSFVGSAALRGRGGVLYAQEVHIFPEALRGSGEGHRPMDGPEQSMTNATVDGVVGATGGQQLHLRYPGGEQTIQVAPDVRVVELIPGDRSLLIPGAAVTVRASRSGDTLTAISIQAEKDGVKPLP